MGVQRIVYRVNVSITLKIHIDNLGQFLAYNKSSKILLLYIRTVSGWEITKQRQLLTRCHSCSSLEGFGPLLYRLLSWKYSSGMTDSSGEEPWRTEEAQYIPDLKGMVRERKPRLRQREQDMETWMCWIRSHRAKAQVLGWSTRFSNSTFGVTSFLFVT